MKPWTVGLLAVAASVFITASAPAQQLKPALAPLEPFIGTWEVEAQWSSGVTMWARTRYEPALDGHFLSATTLVIEQNGTLYERYRSMIGHDAEKGEFPIHSFAFTGDHRVLGFTPDGDGRFTTQWSSGGSEIKELTALHGNDRMEWKVWTKGPDEADWTLALDAEWKRVDDSGPMSAPRLPLTDAMAPLRPLLGTWEVNTAWADGKALWSLWKVDPSPSGTSLQTVVLARDGDGQPYERYRTFFVRNGADDGFEGITFNNKGEVVRAAATMTPGSEPVFESVTPATPSSKVEFVTRCTFTSPSSYRWLVLAREPGTQSEHQVIDAVWTRVSPPAEVSAAPIEPALFAASGPGVRSFVREVTIAASPETVFNAWATKAGWERTYAKGSPATAGNIDLAIGGRYEWLFNGVLGSNGCQVLSYLPNRMISFSWNAPPTQPLSRAQRTWVVVELTPVSESTKVTLTHLGFGDGAHWDETHDYFGNAWTFVLNRMKESLEAKGE